MNKEKMKIYNATYRRSVKGEAAHKAYRHSPEGLAKRRESSKLHNRTPEGRFGVHIHRAKRRGIPSLITFEEFVELTSGRCFYCEGALPPVGSGLDRINSDVGYVVGNCRPCCKWCNQAKSTMSDTEFKEWLFKVFNHWGNR